MTRVYNFSAGPSVMPLPVLEKIQSEMIEHGKSGQSVLEMSHRSKEYIAIWDQMEKDLRDILDVPAHFKILNLQGGATLQFAAIPLNLLGSADDSADYLVTGQWSDRAIKECAKYGKASTVCTGKASNFTSIPDPSTWKLNQQAKYVHYCDNETVHGVEFSYTPVVGDVPLVADMSSNFMSRPIDFSKHAVIYAGAQKNLGPAGNTVVFVDEKYLGKAELPICPTYCSWKTAADAGSMYNTPSCFAVYAMGVYLQHTKQAGGVAHWEEQAKLKSRMLYDSISSSDGFYTCPVDKSCRSRMNVPFQIKGGDEALEKKFLALSTSRKLVNLAGHRSVGGLRASLYNGMSLEGVKELVDFMKDFQQEQGQQ